MPRVRVNVAVLSIADPAARGTVALENIVADRLTEAGHQITSFEAVRDSETAIRSQLVGWIADPEIDVILVVGDGEQTTGAIKPLIDQSLPGFADLLRMLAYQEIGASAMLSTAEGARCGTTFVFVVPGGEAAVKAALDKLILPQLDPATKPRNLIGSMPRLRDAVDHDMTKVDVAKLGEVGPADVTRVDNAKIENARVESTRRESASNSVPIPIAPERTETGAGVKAKLPAGTAPAVAPAAAASGTQRPRPRTGVNVIVRKVDDPTKPIELDKLERQLALSKEEEATKAAQQAVSEAAAASVDTRVTKPPRASIATRPLDVGNLRVPATPRGAAPVATPLPSLKAKSPEPPKPDEASFADIGDSTKPLDLTKPTTPVGAAAIANARPSSSQLVAKGARSSDVGDTTKPLDLGRLPKTPPGAVAEGSDSDETGQIISLPPKPKPANGAAPQAARPGEASTSEQTASPPPTAAPAATPAGSPAAAARVRQTTPPPPPIAAPLAAVARPTPIATRAEPETLDDHASVETLDLEPDAEPVVEPAPVEEAEPAAALPSLLAPPSPAKRRPTQPPPNINELINVAPSSSLAELPQGSFVYPTKRRSKVPLVIGLLVLSAVIGGGGMWLLDRKSGGKAREQVVQPTVEIDAAVPGVAVADIDAAEAEPLHDLEPPDAAVEEPTPPPVKPPAKPTTKPTTRPAKPTTTATTKPTTDVTEAPRGPIAEPGCEEVACVMEKYARPCCARFKPQGDTFQPASADNLSKPQIRAGVDRMKPRVIACAEQHKDVKGTVKISLTVDSEGNVTELSVQTAPDDGLGECVASVMRKAKFAKTANGGSFTYPFVF